MSTIMDDEDDDVRASPLPRTSIPQPTTTITPTHDHVSLAEGNSGGFYPQPVQSSFECSTFDVDDGIEDMDDNNAHSISANNYTNQSLYSNADHGDGGQRNVLDDLAISSGSSETYKSHPTPSFTPMDEEKALNSVRRKLESVVTRKPKTIHSQDMADDVYFEFREALLELKQVIRDIKSKQEMAMVETEAVKDGLDDLKTARQQLEQIQSSMDDVHDAVKLAQAEFAVHRKTLEERTREDEELELKVGEMERETLRLAQIIDDRVSTFVCCFGTR